MSSAITRPSTTVAKANGTKLARMTVGWRSPIAGLEDALDASFLDASPHGDLTGIGPGGERAPGHDPYTRSTLSISRNS